MRHERLFGSLFLVVLLFAPFSHVFAQALTSDERAQLEVQLAQVQAEEVQAENALKAAQSNSSSLQNDINVLAAKVKAEQLQIQAKNLLIKTLDTGISTKQSEIQTLNAQIATNSQELQQMFQLMEQTDDESVFNVILSNNSLSDYVDDEVMLEAMQNGVSTLTTQLGSEESASTAAKNALLQKQQQTADALYATQQTQKSLQSNQSQQKQLLSISKGNEKAYSTLAAQKKAQAAAINARLFALAGGSTAIPFGTAYQYALAAQSRTGIDPAFLLAILTQESNLGSNQGTCYLTDTSTGAGTSIKSGRSFSNVMNPTRDVPPFLTITSALGMDPMHTTVSCPQSVGWGGAMGPAQFIASTWQLLSDRVAGALGTSTSNPWNPRDAFMASAIYLTDLGASDTGYTAESNAACRYYSGSSCSRSALVASYGTSVMSLASTIQSTEIDKL